MEKNNIQFIADRANVSKATVSRVLNNSGPVKAETRQKVLDIIQQYNYTPSALAQGLSKQESSTVGIIVPAISDQFFSSVIRGATEVTDQRNLSLICFDSCGDIHKDVRAIEIFKRQRVKGLLYISAALYQDRYSQRLLKKAFSGFDAPVVLIDRKLDFLKYSGIYFNDYDSIYKATKILIEKGHKRIATINAERGQVLVALRQKGYEQALLDSGIELDPRYEFFENGYTLESGYDAAKKMLAMKELPTALITISNRISQGFVKAIIEEGVRMPEDIVCIGLDRVDFFETMGIRFNYIERDSYLMGIAGIRKLLDEEALLEDTILESKIVINQI